jgi:glycosyltransferase
MQVSLITCTYNSEKTIKDCCLSILSQSYENIEHIVLDKQSQDLTLDILFKYKIKNQKIIQQKNSGIYAAINEGIKAAKGDVVGLLHSDDELIERNVIKKISKIFIEKKVDIIFSNLFYTKKYDKNKILRRWYSNLENGIQSNQSMIKKIQNGWMPPHTTLFIKKNLIEKIGYYNENFKISSDYDFIIRLFKIEDLKIFFLDEFTIKMRSGGISNSSFKNILIKMKEDYNIMRNHKLSPLRTIIFKNFSKIKQFF